MATHNDFGKEAEEQAVNYLTEQGYTILERNFTFQKAEIDIIALKENILVIVEVKARSSTYYGTPETFVNPKKQKLLIEASNHYVIENDLDTEVRFDIIAIVKNSHEQSLNHIKDAFYPF